MLTIDSSNVYIEVNDNGMIETIRCTSNKDGVYYSAKAYPLSEFFKEVRKTAFEQLLEQDKDMFKIMRQHIKKDSENYKFACSLLES